MSTIYHHQQFCILRGLLIALLLVSCLSTASAQRGLIEPVKTDTTTAVSLIDAGNFTNDEGKQVSMYHTVIDNVYYSIYNSGDEETWRGYYDTSDNSIVILSMYDAATVKYEIARAPDPLELVAWTGYTGFVFQVPAGQGTISLETQTYGMLALAVEVGANDPQTFTANTRSEKTVSYAVTEDTYVYVYSVYATSAAKRMGAMAAPVDGVKIFSVKVMARGIPTGIGAVATDNGSLNDGNTYTPAYNLAGQRVGRGYKGIVIRNGRKQVVR